MNKLQCELCGSVDIVKTGDALFQCQHCGCKYTLEEAKKILFGEVTFKAQDFEIVGGRLVKYHGASTVVDIPDTVQVIGKEAFRECSGITAVTIPNSVKRIEALAFYGCSSLTEITIPDSTQFIGNRAFENCSSLQSVVFSDSVTELEAPHFDLWEGFNNCTQLHSVRLSKNLKHIPKYFFHNCPNIKELVIPEGVESIGEESFTECGLEKVTLPYSLKSIHHTAFGQYNDRCKHLTSVEGNRKLFFESVLSSMDYISPYDLPVVVQNKQEHFMENNRCRYCGGSFKGAFTKVCSKCGKKKDY